MKRVHDEVTVIKQLNKVIGCSINETSKVVTVDKENNLLGNKSWGKIDFLTKYKGYVLIYGKVNNNNKNSLYNKRPKLSQEEETAIRNTKFVKIDKIKL